MNSKESAQLDENIKKFKHDIGNELSIIYSFLTICNKIEMDEEQSQMLLNAVDSYKIILSKFECIN